MSLIDIIDVVDYDEDSRNIEGDTNVGTRVVRQCTIGVNVNLLSEESSGFFFFFFKFMKLCVYTEIRMCHAVVQKAESSPFFTFSISCLSLCAI